MRVERRALAARRVRPAAGGGRGGAALPYWGKYVFHDNNRDINLSQVTMRALVDWYFTAYPPIMHDLHESLSLLYTYSGGPPQNPNLDPILFTELPFFSNFELSQMTKWGMPGVYTHGFMDGWSPGYLGSVAYNHNGMMRMYETQSGREGGPGTGCWRVRGVLEVLVLEVLRVRQVLRVPMRLAVRRHLRPRLRPRRRWGPRAGPAPAAEAGRGRGGRGRGEGGRGEGAPQAAAPAATPPRRRRRVRAVAPAADGRPSRPAAAAASRASGIAAFRCRPTRSRTSRAATTPTTCRPACCRRSS